jgi:hypothetical protein
MRTSLKNTIVASLAALTLGLAVVGSTPAAAKPWNHYHGGFWGPGIALGVIGLAGAAAYAASEDDCIRHRPIYDHWGNYMGERSFNVCY